MDQRLEKNFNKSSKPLIESPKNCWTSFSNQKAAALMDGEEYFEAVRTAILSAKKQVMILAWDFDTRIELIRGEQKRHSTKEALRLRQILQQAIRSNPELEIYILCWKFAPIYAWEREFLQAIKVWWTTKRRVHFHFDDQHPIGASHHQKVVCVDDQLAFVGGFDLTKNRWDTTQHAARHSNRVSPDGESYQPFHDVQIAVYHEAAAALGELCRKRWFNATGESVSAPPHGQNKSLDHLISSEFSFHQVDLAIARTVPSYKGGEEVREVEQMYLDLIQRSEKYIYFENQYLSSRSIAQALEDSLKKSDGPEIILVLPKKAEGPVEEAAMRQNQDKILAYLKSIDHDDRLQVFCPDDPQLPENQQIKVHSKVVIADDRWFRIGSSNLNNRSMGLDTECDVLIDGGENPKARQKIRQYLIRSLAHFLHIDDHELPLGLIKPNIWEAIKKCPSHPTHLPRYPERKINREEPNPLEQSPHLDPEEPFIIEQLIDRALYRKRLDRIFANGRLGLFMTGLICTIVAAIWVLTPFQNFFSLESLSLTSTAVPESLLKLGLSLVAFTVFSLLFIPLNLMITITACAIPGWEAFSFITLGVLFASLVGYSVGRFLLPYPFPYFPEQLLKLRKKMKQASTTSIALVRIAPIAPFGVVNVLLGTQKLDLKRYLAGTFLGTFPRILGIAIFQKTLIETIATPTIKNFGISAITIFVLVNLFIFMQKRVKRYDS
jgi:phosphatidylserine/phosphatidylglycerophosphate/cardiolipin synthase-like enzyme/uncharacterized membrane protein YdjX (TVP38/TMEM64 family)